MTAHKLLFALFAPFAILSLHACGGEEDTALPVVVTTDNPAAATTSAAKPPPSTVSGSLTFKMSTIDALAIVASQSNPEVKEAFAEALAAGLEGVASTDIVITKISSPESGDRRLEGRNLQDTSSLVVDYAIIVTGAAPDVAAIDTAAVATQTQTGLNEVEGLEVKVEELETPEAPVADSDCQSAHKNIAKFEVETFGGLQGPPPLDIIPSFCEELRTLAEYCTATEYDAIQKDRPEIDGPGFGPPDYDEVTSAKVTFCGGSCGTGFLKIMWAPRPEEPEEGNRRALSLPTGTKFRGLGRRLDGHLMSDAQCAAVADLQADATCTNADFLLLKMEGDCPTEKPDDVEWDDWECPDPVYNDKDSMTKAWGVGCGPCGKGWETLMRAYPEDDDEHDDHDDHDRRVRALSGLERRLGGHIMSDELCAAWKTFDDNCPSAGFDDMAEVYNMIADCPVEEPDDWNWDEDGDWNEKCPEERPIQTKDDMMGHSRVFCGACFKAFMAMFPPDQQRARSLSVFVENTLMHLERRLDGHLLSDERCEAVNSFDDACPDEGFDQMAEVMRMTGPCLTERPDNVQGEWKCPEHGPATKEHTTKDLTMMCSR
jgi:hypothetical protein